MNEENQNKINEILNWVEQTVKTVENFTLEQAPLYIQELLLWNFCHSLIFFSLGVIALLASLFLVKKFIEEINKEYIRQDDNLIMAFSNLGFLGLIFSPIFILNHLDWLKIKLAPRAWLVEYAQELIK